MASGSSSRKQVAGAAVAAVAGAWYLNDRFSLSADISSLLHVRANRKSVEKRIAELGDNATIYRMLEFCRPEDEALWFEHRTWTYAELKKGQSDLSISRPQYAYPPMTDIDKFATVLERRGISEGDSVALFTTNSPEMIIALIALTRIGAVPALINTSLRSQTLAHCLGVAKAKMIILTPDLASAAVDLFNETSTAVPCISLNLSSFPPLQLSNSSHTSLITQVRYEDLYLVSPSTTPLPKRGIASPGLLIYTSGTSGKPKAVNIKNLLLIVVSTPLSYDTANKSRYFPLRTYSCLPLYHGTGLFAGLYYSVGNSSTLCLARKFTARRFTYDLTTSRATRMVYVGELCRYLLAAPTSPSDTAHSVIVAAGNGMAKDVWLQFRSRFNIPEIREFYRSTEGQARFDNFSRTSTSAGFVGRQGPIRRWFEQDTFLVRYDPVTEQPWRDPVTGFCRVVGSNEPGEAIGRIPNPATYNEYLDNEAANRDKVIRDVFVQGDAFQRMGDLLVQNEKGWVSFLDRTGDTYRWRGENVAAGEVREHVSRLPEVVDCSVYAVKLAGYDGQAGAAGITLQPGLEGEREGKFMEDLFERLRKGGLTVWQVPRLVRVTARIDTGSTFKHAKEVLKQRSWDPSVGVDMDGDRLYWLNGERYFKLDVQSWNDIQAGRARL